MICFDKFEFSAIMNFTIFAASTVKPPHAGILTVRGSSYLSPRIDHPLCLRFAYLKSLTSFIMMSSRAASASVRRVGGGFVASTNISSKAESDTANVHSTMDNDGIVNATDIPVADDDIGPLINLFNESDDIDLDVPDGMRVVTALSGGTNKAASTAGGMGEAASLKSNLSTGSQSAKAAPEPSTNHNQVKETFQ